MFSCCKNLKFLDLSSFDTKNVTNMNDMFSNCSNLINLDLSSFDLQNVNDMNSMFYGCSKLNILRIVSFDTKNVVNKKYMYCHCPILNTNLKFSSIDSKIATTNKNEKISIEIVNNEYTNNKIKINKTNLNLPSKSMCLETILEKLLSVRDHKPGKQANLRQEEIEFIIEKSIQVIKQEKIFIELEAPLNICGDIHGQFYDLLRIFQNFGYPGEFNYLFLGNYVDFGKQSLEVICLLLCYKIKYPDNITLLRGNHESSVQNRKYGFYKECKRRYNLKIWKAFSQLFNYLEYDENDRGISVIFGEKVVLDFNRKHNIDLIVRGNQVFDEGYEFFANRNLVSIFSAPAFRGEFDNSAAILIIDEYLNLSIKVLRPLDIEK